MKRPMPELPFTLGFILVVNGVPAGVSNPVAGGGTAPYGPHVLGHGANGQC
jgi:hypothetical protein